MSVEIETSHNSCVSDTAHSISLSGSVEKLLPQCIRTSEDESLASISYLQLSMIFFLAINCPWIWFHLFSKKNDSTSCGTKRRQGWKGRELQPLLCATCSSCCHRSIRWPGRDTEVEQWRKYYSLLLTDFSTTRSWHTRSWHFN